jgi:hypothetical protein
VLLLTAGRVLPKDIGVEVEINAILRFSGS